MKNLIFQTKRIRQRLQYKVVILPVFVFSILSALFTACKPDSPQETEVSQSPDSIVVSAFVPPDIFNNGDSAYNATLYQAGIFAWKEFIALNWSAKIGSRDSADASIAFGTNPEGIPLVWHTFRHKVEIFPGNNQPPHGYINNPDSAYGYNGGFNPAYFYNPQSTATTDGQILPLSGIPSKTTPWINLDETNEIFEANMYAGIGDTTQNANMMLYLAKANKAEYTYAVSTGWYNGQNGLSNAQAATKNYIKANSNTPRPGQSDSLVSLPYGTIEIKTAWRKLTATELSSGRFYTNTVRYYVEKNDSIRYKDEVFGMVALHIIHKTPTAPYFIFATFEQTDNILTTDGKPVEDEEGKIINNIDSAGLTPNIKVTNATPTAIMTFDPSTAHAVPGKSLYYRNLGNDQVQGTVRINTRLNPIPADIITANTIAHKAINTYSQKNNLSNSVWQYYKLVNVQHKPINKPTPGVDYHGADSSSYYQSNSVVESDYILQKFSGKFAQGGTISDFADANGTPAFNAYHNGKFLMGGCMGCHGNATNGGLDYSFIFGSPVKSPAPARQITAEEAEQKLHRFLLRLK